MTFITRWMLEKVRGGRGEARDKVKKCFGGLRRGNSDADGVMDEEQGKVRWGGAGELWNR